MPSVPKYVRLMGCDVVCGVMMWALRPSCASTRGNGQLSPSYFSLLAPSFA
jgi:hypothetical protein